MICAFCGELIKDGDQVVKIIYQIGTEVVSEKYYHLWCWENREK